MYLPKIKAFSYNLYKIVILSCFEFVYYNMFEAF